MSGVLKTEKNVYRWRRKPWIFITDPDFAAKAQQVLDLYARVCNGKPLGRNDYVISADEKTSIQARCRCHPTLPAAPARPADPGHDYHRPGAVAYLAAYDVHHAKVFGRCEDTTGIVAFTDLVVQVMTQEPTSRPTGCFGSWTTAPCTADARRSTGSPAVPQRGMVHTPVHAF